MRNKKIYTEKESSRWLPPCLLPCLSVDWHKHTKNIDKSCSFQWFNISYNFSSLYMRYASCAIAIN